MNPSIFREYDIRGVVEQDLGSADVEKIARGFSTYASRAGVKKVTLGRDVRVSSDSLREAMISGLLKCGMQVIDIGVVPTPLLYFSIHEFEADGGVMITGSHNPPEYNGFKLCVGNSAIYGEKIQEIKRIIQEGTFVEGKGSLEKSDVNHAYSDCVENIIHIERPVKAVVDCGNGTAGLIAPGLFKTLGMEVIPIFEEPDGMFPNHFPDPTVPENLKQLIEKVREVGAEVGVAYDGDADRIGVVDEKGGLIFGDYLLAIFSRELLTRKAGATIISEVKASQNLYDDIAKRGGNPIMYRTGHSLIKKKMKETGAELAGEMSGHIFFKDRYFGYDDAIYASARLFEILSRTETPLSSYLSDLPELISTPEIRVDCPDEFKFPVVEDVRQSLEGLCREMITIDGVRARFDGGWGLVRASNTQPVLVLRFEASSEEDMARIRDLVEKSVQEALTRHIDGN